MNEQLWWYLARGSGIVAFALLVLSLIWGVLLATRALKPVDRPAWLLDVHKWLSGSTVVMTVLHMFSLYMDSYVEFTVADLLVPGVSSWKSVAVAIGVVSTYLIVVVQATSYMRRWLSRRAWRAVHMLSYLSVLAAALHAGLAGTDTGSIVYQVFAAVLIAGAAGATALRIITPRRVLRSPQHATSSR